LYLSLAHTGAICSTTTGHPVSALQLPRGHQARYANLNFAAYTTPALTTIRTYGRQIGELAASMLWSSG
jgi:hypothetical protein